MDEDILRAHIASFFQSQDASERANAEAALSSFGKSDGSWSVLLRVLERDDATAVETLFCARTLHVLLRRRVAKEERTQASHAAFTERDWIDLRSRVLKLTMLFAVNSSSFAHDESNASRAVDLRSTLTQLALATSALACKMPTWDPTAVVRDVIKVFQEDARVSNEAKLLCLCTFLAFVPQEASSRELSIHPARREQVLTGLRSTANDVMDLLQQLATSASGDTLLHKYILDALAAWADIANVTPRFPRVILEGALHIVCSEDHHANIKQSAASAACASLVQCVWTSDTELRALLATSLAKLRAEVVKAERSEESRALIVDVLSSVAMKALRDQKDASKSPFATGPDAAGDRTYVKYAEFKSLQRQQKKTQRSEQKQKTNIAVDIDTEVLLFALDGLSEALSVGASMASALEPWGKLAKSFTPDSFVELLRPVAERCVHAAVLYVQLLPKHDLDDDQVKEEISDCLRDVISAVPIEEILGDFNQRLCAEMSAAQSGGWRTLNARLYVLLSLAKSFRAEANQSSFAILIENLCTLLTSEVVPKATLESTCWVLAGVAKCISQLEDNILLGVSHALIRSMSHSEFVVARGAAVAMMKLSEFAASRLGATDVPSLLAELHVRGGPTPSPTLRLGQEHESTVLLRALTFYVKCECREQTESACASLAEPVIEAMNVSLHRGSSEEYVRRLVDLDIVLRAMKSAYEHIQSPSEVLAGLATRAAIAVEQTSLRIVDHRMVEERFKVAWAMKALVELARFVDGLLGAVVRISVEAYMRAPGLGACYLDALSVMLEFYGDSRCEIEIGGTKFQSVGHVVVELLATVLPASLEDCEGWTSAFTLARATLRTACVAIVPHLRMMVEVSQASLRGVSDEPAAAALLFATDLLRAPVMLSAELASTAKNASASAMHAGLGRLAAEISGQSNKKRGTCEWNRRSAKPVADAVAAAMESHSVVIVRKILEAANGEMPPSMISDISAALHLVWSTYGTERFQGVMLAALGGEDDAFPKPKTKLSDKREWVAFLTNETCANDCRVFKRFLKSFLGGKKVGKN